MKHLNEETPLPTDATLRGLRNPLVTRDRVLVVEDDPDLRMALAEHLNARGFEVNTASDGISALETLRRIDHDVVLLDLGIPRMTGRKFLHELRCDANIEDVPIVLLTGSDENDIHSAAKHGVFAVHRKPTKPRLIAQSLRSAAYFS